MTNNNISGVSVLSGKRVCTSCVQEAVLKHRIRINGVTLACSFCQRRRKTFSLADLASEIDAAFKEHYVKVTDDDDGFGLFSHYGFTEDDGMPVVDAIADAAGVSLAIATDIQRVLESMNQSRSAYEIGEETPYADTSRYQIMRPDDAGMREDWTAFEHELKQRARFFNRRGADLLTSVFENIDRLSVRGQRQLVVTAGPGMQLQRLFRARVFQSESALLEALKNPEQQLGSPPPRLAAAGRMNARGISVFYGADTLLGAVAEVRPPVGSKVAVAAFDIVRHVTLLDLTALPLVDHVPGSIFDRSTKKRTERIVFLRTLGERMTKPVMPDEQEIEYLVTQAIADFLSTEYTPRFDGIIFESVQTPDSRNVVLFNHSSTAAVPMRLEGTRIEAHKWNHYGEEPDDSYLVIERVPSTINASPPIGHDWSETDLVEPTLRLDRACITVQHVAGVSYSTLEHNVVISRFELGDDEF